VSVFTSSQIINIDFATRKVTVIDRAAVLALDLPAIKAELERQERDYLTKKQGGN
jgi:hypothetical protein